MDLFSTSHRLANLGLARSAAAALFLACWMMASYAQAPKITADSIRQELTITDQILWEGQSLRDGLANLTHSWNIPIFLDRRVDPNQLIDFESSSRTRDELLRQLATQIGLKVCVVDTVVYVGPAGTTDVVASVAETRFDESQKWATTAGRGHGLRKRSLVQWEDAAEPREILQKITSDARLKIVNLDQVPHDLWPAASWPNLPVTHQLTLILAGFGLTYEFDESEPVVRIIPLPVEFSLVREYSLPDNARQRLASLKEKYAQATFDVKGKKVTVTGSAEDHYWIRRGIAGLAELTPRSQQNDRVRYTLTIEQQPFNAVAAKLAQALQLRLQYDEQIDEQLKMRRIDMKTRDATREQLLDELVKTINMRYTMKDGTLLIHP